MSAEPPQLNRSEHCNLVRRIARVAEIVLPLMALTYALLALVIVAINITNLPGVVVPIVRGAFGLQKMAGGFTGGIAAAMLNGIRRGPSSNEAGMGSAPTWRRLRPSRIRSSRA